MDVDSAAFKTIQYLDRANNRTSITLRFNKHADLDVDVFVELRRVIDALGYVHEEGPSRVIGQRVENGWNMLASFTTHSMNISPHPKKW